MDLIPYDQDKRIMKARTAKTKDQKPVIKMVTLVEQATEMVKSEIKREREMEKIRPLCLQSDVKTSHVYR